MTYKPYALSEHQANRIFRAIGGAGYDCDLERDLYAAIDRGFAVRVTVFDPERAQNAAKAGRQYVGNDHVITSLADFAEFNAVRPVTIEAMRQIEARRRAAIADANAIADEEIEALFVTHQPKPRSDFYGRSLLRAERYR